MSVVETENNLKVTSSLNEVWPSRRDRSLGSRVPSTHDQGAIEIIVLSPGVEGITQQQDKQQNHGKKRPIVQCQPQADRHELTLFLA